MLYFFGRLGTELRALYMLGRCSTIELQLQPFLYAFKEKNVQLHQTKSL